MKRETPMAFLAGVAVTGAFFAGMGVASGIKAPAKVVAAKFYEHSGADYLVLEDGTVMSSKSRAPGGGPGGGPGRTQARWWEIHQPPIGKMLDPRPEHGGQMKDWPTIPSK